jgi:phosphoribosylglycinamide formyltransferase-1
VVVLASGSGSNLQALIDAAHAQQLHATVVGVVSDKADAGALVRAERHQIPAVHLGRLSDEPRADYDRRLADVVEHFRPDWVVLAGFMRLLTHNFLGRFPNRVINLHPALPGELPGTLAIERAYEQAQQGRRSHTGVMVHLVPDEGIDNGPVLATAEVPILSSDSLADLQRRVHAAEHRLLVSTLHTLCTEGARA